MDARYGRTHANAVLRGSARLRQGGSGLVLHSTPKTHSPTCLMQWFMQWREQLDKKGFAAGPTAGRILGYKGHVPGKQNQVGVASNEYD